MRIGRRIGGQGMRGTAVEVNHWNVPRPVLSPGVRVAHVALLQRRQLLLEALERRRRQRRAVQIQLAETLHICGQANQ